MFRNGLGENAEFYRYHPIVNFVYFALVIGITMFSMSPYFLAVTFGFSWIYSVLLRGKGDYKIQPDDVFQYYGCYGNHQSFFLRQR